jgi:hypothetical protein
MVSFKPVFGKVLSSDQFQSQSVLLCQQKTTVLAPVLKAQRQLPQEIEASWGSL